MNQLIRWVVALLAALTAISSWAAYTDNGDGTVTDSATGLTWMRCALGQTWDGTTCTGFAATYTWDEAKALTQTFAGQSDWRLPNVRELQTIVDRSRYAFAIDTTAFPGLSSSSHSWSASAYASYSSNAWYVRFDNGRAYSDLKSKTFQARLVRAGQSSALFSETRPDTDYTDNGDGTVTHKPTGLMWKRCSEGQTWTGSICSGTASGYTWSQAQGLSGTFAGKSDWRLPTEEELISLADYTKSTGPVLNTTWFPGTPASSFWSASAYAGNSGYAWAVGFSYGDAGFYTQSSVYRARLVRAGQSIGALASTTTTTSTTSTTTLMPTTTTSTTTSPTSTTTTQAPTTTTTSTTTTTTLPQRSMEFAAGWNLVGNGAEAAIDVAAAFGDTAKVTTVWKWIAPTARWAFYAPTLGSQALADYAAGKGYEVLNTVAGGEGFWVNAKTGFSVPLPAGAAVASSSFRAGNPHPLPRGWNLIATGDSPAPGAFDCAIGPTTCTAAGAWPTNLTTLWAWDAGRAGWYFWAPSLVNSNGLAAYLANKGYLDFSTLPTTPPGSLSPSTGFWVNVP